MKYETKSFEIDLKGNIIPYRAWTSKEERLYLTNKGQGSDFALLSKMLVLPNIEYKPMTLAEYEYLIFELRRMSVASEVGLNVRCPKCDMFIEFERDMLDLLHFVAPTLDNKEISHDDISINLRKIPSKDLLLRVVSQETTEQRVFFEFLACIKSITYKGETLETFSFEEIEEFFDDMPSFVFKKLFNQFLELKGYIHLFTEVTCPHPHCLHKFDAVFKNVDDFL